MDTLIIYHSRDLDGWCSGAIAYRYYHMLNHESEITLLGYDYGDDLTICETAEEDYSNFVQCANFDRIILLDIIITDINHRTDTIGGLDNMLYLISWGKTKGKEFIWIDHHKSSIEGFPPHVDVKAIPGILNTKYAACELAWMWFYPDTLMPTVVHMLGRYDCFGHKGTDEERDVLLFQYAARARWSGVQDILDENNFFVVSGILKSELLKEGKVIYSYLCTEAKQIFDKHGVVDFDGFAFGVVNRERFNPINFGINYHELGLDGFACYWDTSSGRSWSLYNDNDRVDCSVICKARGGGGHKGAAGFIQNIAFPPYELMDTLEPPTVLGNAIEYLYGVGALDITEHDLNVLKESLLKERPVDPDDAFLKTTEDVKIFKEAIENPPDANEALKKAQKDIKGGQA